MTTATLRVGTSGYSYPEWKGTFYPRDLPPSDFLAYYAGRFSTVEINNTFYRFPTEPLLAGWREGTPAGFTFAVKANQRITHQSRLKGVEELTEDFVERCRALGEKLAAILFQLPPSLRRDDSRLALFLASLPPDLRYAIEFRHESWYEDAVFEALGEAGVALCIAEAEDAEAPRVVTADFAYLRLRKESYEPKELRAWRAWIDEQLRQGRDVLAYLKHDEEGVSPELALRLLETSSTAGGDSRAPAPEPRAMKRRAARDGPAAKRVGKRAAPKSRSRRDRRS